MKVAISNIAWDPTEDEAIAGLLSRHGIENIDIAPGKYFPTPLDTSTRHTTEVREWWSHRGIRISGMQSLLFGTSGLNIFGSKESQDAMISHLASICRIGAELGATRLTFGSPKNRDRGALTDDQANDIASSFFSTLGAVAGDSGVTICIEPNPASYGANFLTDTASAANFVRAIGHPAIRLQIDTGAIAMNDEDPREILPSVWDIVGHIHVSEPYLAQVGCGNTNHTEIAAEIRKLDESSIVTVEMLPTGAASHLSSVEQSILFVCNKYGR